ncbi:ComEC/Rec2 family competence protein [Wenxinia marina]|uniref:ComEC/Rec2-related protein n=1 Tax=Wenxinia marina DSM 24838 TaxID=1123501 RepID=A0A0D0NKU1_9RHOB|nr:ComEC/Rec2 family competence protein [Wenxinia marina]KIQ68930.1 ComEC/Rec2-related protein [Wenxinia marina DSM 24838]GGL64015.1 hypothetical protein GCM10011392_18400 [Wenxinia marina]
MLTLGRIGPAGGLLSGLAAALQRQRGHLATWSPVALAAGIGGYFALPAEPDAAAWVALALAALAAFGAARLAPEALAPLFAAFVFVAAGAALAGVRTHLTAAPVLPFRYYGPVEGRVVEIDRSASDAVRLTLDRVVLEDMAPDRTPRRVRLSLHGDQRWSEPQPGMTVILTGHLGPPAGPVEPGGFDFRLSAWFEGLGAVGYTRTPLLVWAAPDEGAGLVIHRLRGRIADGMRHRIDGDAGGFAAAVTTGDRSGLTRAATDALRDANLYHLVAISGMHMGLLVGFVFWMVRGAVSAIPLLALRLSSKKIAAVAALPAAAFYLALAGRALATERAFVMAAVALVAILLDRRVLTLRSVAVAALVMLVLRPEALLNPGFQMSFAAVTALVAGFAIIGQPLGPRWRWAVPAVMLLLSSALAGAATAPFAAAHFNRVAHYGLLANLLAVPAMGLLVMPGAVLAALLAPLGLAAPALWMMQAGSAWILRVAEWVGAMDGAVSTVVSPPAGVLPLLSFGALVVILWQGRGRWAGLAPVALAGWMWVTVDRPALLVTDTGGLIGLIGPEGRALSRGTGDGFAATVWLENDGDRATQEEAAARPGVPEVAPRTWRTEIGGAVVLAVRGTGALAALDGCGDASLLVTNAETDVPRPCDVYDAARLRRTGALAIRPDGQGGLAVLTVADVAGRRPWSQ